MKIEKQTEQIKNDVFAIYRHLLPMAQDLSDDHPPGLTTRIFYSPDIILSNKSLSKEEIFQECLHLEGKIKEYMASVN